MVTAGEAAATLKTTAGSVGISYGVSLYRRIASVVTTTMQGVYTKNPALLYLITPIAFLIASQSYLFKNANGSLNAFVESLLKQIEQGKPIDSMVDPLSILAVTISSIVAIGGGGGLGSEMPSVYIGVCSLLYLSTFVTKGYLEQVFYLGYAIAFTVVFGSPLASLSLILEKSINHQSTQPLLNVLVAITGICIAYYVKDPIASVEVLSEPLDGSYLSVLTVILYCIFILICSVLAVFLLKSMGWLFGKASSSGYTNLIAIAAGLLVAAIINNTDIYSSGLHPYANAFTSSSAVFNVQNVLGRILNIILTFVSGASGGLIMPSLSTGAGLGSLFAEATGLHRHNLMLTGMTAFLSAIYGNPVTVGVTVSVISGQDYTAYPILIGIAALSSAISRGISSLL